MTTNRTTAILVLENGAIFNGFSFGYEKDSLGEVCFNTSMTGYQEILTDPSYKEQIVTLTYPMIGNYGINSEYNQSSHIQAQALIVKEYVDFPSNYSSQMSLSRFLKDNETPAMEGIDTRNLVLTLRSEGAMKGGVFVGRDYSPEMLEQVKSQPSMSGLDLASRVTTNAIYTYGNPENKRFKVGVFDYGVKTNILKNLDRAGFAVEVLPASTPIDVIRQRSYDCYFFSNGPGDPEPVEYAIATIRQLMEDNRPMFGICLGHQLLGLASGQKTYKLKFGHRGGNQPVKDFQTGRVEITAQNHGFAVESPKGEGYHVHQINLNDKTVEGFFHSEKKILSVQYHPEAAPGPNDSLHLFRDFYKMVEEFYS